MTMNLKKLLILIGVFLALTASVSAPAAADAGTTAYNSKTQYLSQWPLDNWDNSCVERRIYLAAGNYDWEQFWRDSVTPLRTNLYLGAGWYTWTDCLDPRNNYYDHTTSLNPDNPNWETVVGEVVWQINSSGEYTWGSFLEPKSF
ncbi:hypothetical protein ACSDR0_42720 [Streptosporangium sp. G11]|uniref:hypothetical protein n=1 Tax=Streptosporangium sp. G11 TaxID=3436926 RepID=UPI003EB869C8